MNARALRFALSTAAIALGAVAIASMSIAIQRAYATTSTNSSGSEPSALLRVRAEPETRFYKQARTVDKATREALMRTAVAQLRSWEVLQTAINDPSLKDLKLGSDTVAVRTLRDRIVARFEPESELLNVHCTGLPHDEAVLVINAVTDSFVNKVLDDDRSRNSKRIDVIQKQFESTNKDINIKLKMLHLLGEVTGSHETQRERHLEQLIASDLLLNNKLKTERVAVSTLLARLKARKPQTTAVVEKIEELSDNLAVLDAQTEQTAKWVAEYQKELETRESSAPDLSLEANEIRIKEASALRLGRELERLQLDSSASGRISIIERAG